MSQHPNASRYEVLKAKKAGLKEILNRYKHMKATPNYTALKAKHDMLGLEIKSLFKTHA